MSGKSRILFLYPNEPFLNPPPVGIGILSAALKERGFCVDLFDTTFYPRNRASSDEAKLANLQVKPFSFEERGVHAEKTDMLLDLRKKVISFKPDIICLSLLEGTYQLGLSMLEAIGDLKIPVVAGGVFPTMSPDEVLSSAHISCVCIGEGEYALPDFCEAFLNGRDYSKIKNIWFKDKDGKITRNDLCAVVDLDRAPIPDYDIFDQRRFFRPMAGHVYKTVPIETNRGCSFQCAFCNSPVIAALYADKGLKGYFRKKSPGKIREELKCLIDKYRAEYVYFSSDTFLTMSEADFDDFIKVYSEFKLPFWIQTRAETVRADRIKRLKEVGCHRISMGLEHGNEDFRKRILRKPFKNKEMLEAGKIINHAGIPLTVNNIIGFPFEDRKLVFDTIELNRKINSDDCNAYAFYPFKGTRLYDVARKNNFIKSGSKSPVCVTTSSVIDMPALSNSEIMGLVRTFVLYVRLPKKFWKDIKRAEQGDEEGNRIFEELKGVYAKSRS